MSKINQKTHTNFHRYLLFNVSNDLMPSPIWWSNCSGNTQDEWHYLQITTAPQTVRCQIIKWAQPYFFKIL